MFDVKKFLTSNKQFVVRRENFVDGSKTGQTYATALNLYQDLEQTLHSTNSPSSGVLDPGHTILNELLGFQRSLGLDFKDL